MAHDFFVLTYIVEYICITYTYYIACSNFSRIDVVSLECRFLVSSFQIT